MTASNDSPEQGKKLADRTDGDLTLETFDGELEPALRGRIAQ